MLKRIGALLVGVSVCAGLLGCVSADTYRLKEQEAQSLSTVNADIRARNKLLRSEKAGLEARLDETKKENEALMFRVEKQNKEIGFLKNWAATLEKDGDLMRARMEKLNAKIAELDKENQKLATLSLPENLLRSLGDRLADLKKQVELLSAENDKLKSRHAMFRPEEKEKTIELAIGKEKEKRMELAAGKTQPVLVPSDEKDDDSEPQKQPVIISPAEKEDNSEPEKQQNDRPSRDNWRRRAAQVDE